MENMDDLLAGLNSEQREAVEINSGSLLVFAGAGSGKTRVITTKIAYAIKVLGYKPWQILAVTFTNKACREMKERVESYIGSDASNVEIRTFHSFGVRLLRRYGTRVGLSPDFTIYDDKDAAVLLSQCYPNVPKKEIEAAAKKVLSYKDNMTRPPKFDTALTGFFNAYNQKLSETGNVDFADMILKSIDLLSQNPDIKEHIHGKFKMILVDEYQDSNTAQFILLRELVGPETFICVVGDDDQSIYRFRGAQVENILNFPKVFSHTKTVVLGKNYRCSSAILNAAQDVILHNKSRAQKNLRAEKQGGMKPKLFLVDSEMDEAQRIVNMIKQEPPTRHLTTAILYRTNAQSKAFEDKFIINSIPYNIVGSLKFYDREEIRDSIALISLLVNPFDSVAFQRMVNKPARGIGDVSISKILSMSGSPIENAEKAVQSGEIKGKAASGIELFLKSYRETKEFAERSDNGVLLAFMLKSFGIIDYYTKRDAEENLTDSNRVNNLGQLTNMLSSDAFSNGIEGLHAFLEFVSLDPSSLGSADNSYKEGAVTLITMHNTKGLEFDRVFITGMEDEIFPSMRSESTERDLEEERRICYVAITRAKSELYFFSAKMRFLWGHQEYHTPSRFLSEIKSEHIDVADLRSSLSRERYGSDSAWGYSSYGRSYGNTGNAYFADGNNYSGRNSAYGFKDKESYYYERDSDFDRLKANRGSYLRKTSGDSYESWYPEEKKNESKPKASLVKRGAVSASGGVNKPVHYEIGDRVRSSILGEGEITSKRMFGKKELLVVKFDNGRIGNFVSDKADFEKLEKK